jgi:hypothetical protein
VTSPSPSAGLLSRATAAAGVSPKVNSAALGSAVATIFWSIAAATFLKNTFSDSTLAALTGATATILAYLFGYFASDPLRRDGDAGQGPPATAQAAPATQSTAAAAQTTAATPAGS